MKLHLYVIDSCVESFLFVRSYYYFTPVWLLLVVVVSRGEARTKLEHVLVQPY